MKDKPKALTEFTVTTTCFAPPGSPLQPSQVAVHFPPDYLKDLKTWKDVGRNMALGFYRLYSGDHRGEELVKEFDKL